MVTVPHLNDADSLLFLHGCEADSSEFLVVHKLGKIVDTQTSLRDVDVLVPEFGPFQIFKLIQKDRAHINVGKANGGFII